MHISVFHARHEMPVQHLCTVRQVQESCSTNQCRILVLVSKRKQCAFSEERHTNQNECDDKALKSVLYFIQKVSWKQKCILFLPIFPSFSEHNGSVSLEYVSTNNIAISMLCNGLQTNSIQSQYELWNLTNHEELAFNNFTQWYMKIAPKV